MLRWVHLKIEHSKVLEEQSEKLKSLPPKLEKPHTEMVTLPLGYQAVLEFQGVAFQFLIIISSNF